MKKIFLLCVLLVSAITIKSFAIDDGILFFDAPNAQNKYSLWATDGTEEGTVVINKDYDTYHGEMAEYKNQMLFFSNKKLFRSDGTHLGTIEITPDSPICFNLENSFINDDYLYTYNYDYLIAEEKGDFWKTDGTKKGTGPISLGEDVPELKMVYSVFSKKVGDKLYFTQDPVYWSDLWMTDLKTKKTIKLFGFETSEAVNRCQLIPVGNQFFFMSENDAKNQLWVSDGSPENSKPLKGIEYPKNLTPLKENIIFTAYESKIKGRAFGNALYRSDGTSGGTVLLKKFPASHIYGWTKMGNAIYFTASDEIHGYELWKTDGTPEGTVLVKDINPGKQDGILHYENCFTAAGHLIYFIANDGKTYDLWRTDGTEKGTIPLEKQSSTKNRTAHILRMNSGEKENGNRSYEGHGIGDEKGNYYFWDGGKLWKSNGSVEGTEVIKNFLPENGWFNLMGELQLIDEMLYFYANDGQHMLWKSDGTEKGTVKVKSLGPDTAGWLWKTHFTYIKTD